MAYPADRSSGCMRPSAWTWAHGYIGPNPVDVIDHLLPSQNGNDKGYQPAIPWRDCKGFIVEHLRTRALTGSIRVTLEFTVLTAARSGEVWEMAWDEIDFNAKVWTVPADRTKTGVWHHVPLSGRALEILMEQRANQLRLPLPAIDCRCSNL